MSSLRFLMLLALIVWIGGIIFFAFALAPTLFLVLPTTHMAGDVVSVSLTKLHWMGLISGAVFLVCSLIYNRLKHAQLKLFAAGHILMVVMLALTAISQFGITPRLRLVRSQLERSQDPDYIPYIPGSTPSLIAMYSEQFNSLHAWSTRLEGGVLLCGLVVAGLTARRFSSN
ncbi:MAG TPA: DUF4149 domain-containing protein [Candidatus Angelobacter sp.]|nr:DUF4149 domain-containing protein [Candidatus Angelobacter sp.]